MENIGDQGVQRQAIERLEDPPVAKALFGDVRLAWLWLILRLYLGWQWLEAGWGKLNNPAWTGNKAEAAITGFVQGALQKTAGEHPMCKAGMHGSCKTWFFQMRAHGATWWRLERPWSELP